MGANRRVLTVYLVGVFIGALDVNVLGPALRLIAHGFGTTLAWTAWTVTAYTVAYVASTVLAGPLGDRLGHRRLFTLGATLFGVASLGAALSPTFATFIVARIIQGAGAGAVYPNAQAEGIRQFPPERRGTALGIFGAVFGLASVIGPNAGGALAQFYGWPAIFLVNVPIIALVLFLARRLPESKTTRQDVPDTVGGISFGVLLASALLALALSSDLRFVLAAVAVLAALVFVHRQRTSAFPFLNPAPFREAQGPVLLIGAALIGLDMSSAVFVPTLAQETLHMGVFASGLALMPAAVSGAILAGAAGVGVDRIGPKPILLTGLVAAALGGVLLADPSLSFGLFILAMVFFGIGTAFTMGAPINRMALSLYPEAQAAEALSLVAVFRSVGIASGPILLTMAMAWKGFEGMYGTVALASVLGFALFASTRGTGDTRSPAGRVS